MSDYTYYQQYQTDYNYVQLSQKCMRCSGYLLGDQEIVSDPRYRNCESHAECVRWEDEDVQPNVSKTNISKTEPDGLTESSTKNTQNDLDVQNVK